MASNQTQNYALPQWQGTDPFSMAEFNDTFAKIDTAVKTAQDTANQAVQAAAQAAAQNLRVIAGTYTGDGYVTRTFNLGVTPKLVFVAMYGSATFDNGYFYGGFATPDCPTRTVSVVDGGFQVAHSSTENVNSKGTDYAYFALI